MIFGTSEGIVDGCFHPDCIRKNPDGSPTLPRYVHWLRVGDLYCSHLQAWHGHEFAQYTDRFRPIDQDHLGMDKCHHKWIPRATLPATWRCRHCRKVTKENPNV